MGTSLRRKQYFTKHLFGAGVECPTKLFYYAENYPENQEAVPFIEHAIFNKRLVRGLARSAFPGGIFIDEETIKKAAQETQKRLQRDEVILFDPIFEYQKVMSRLAILQKSGNQLTAFQMQTKAYDSRKHRLTSKEGRIYDKWRSYLLDFAYQLYPLKQKFPDHDIQALLVMPEKSGRAYTDNLPSLLHALEKGTFSESIPLANQELLVKLDVSDLINKVWYDSGFADEYLPKSTFEDSVNYLRNLYFEKEKATPPVGQQCKDCEFRTEVRRIKRGTKSGFNECWSPHMKTENPSETHVFDLIGPGTNHWIRKGVYDQREIALDDVRTPESVVKAKGRITHAMRQALQIHKVQAHSVPEEIFRPAIAKELKRWKYPLHFLDFEAGNYAIPVKENRSPYHLVVFQFSCHTLQENGEWVHYQWLDDLQSGYPNYELVRQLMQVPDIEEGTIIQYSNFERNALKKIRNELVAEKDQVHDAEELIAWMEKIIQRNDSSHHQPPYVADLSRLVKNFYYNREMRNSLSIKDVLRSVMSHCNFLKEKYSNPYNSHNFEEMLWWQPDGMGGTRNPYKLLMETGEAPIRRGTEAMVVYGKLIAKQWSAEELSALRQALLKYCELDTLAMVMIYQHWKYKLLSD